MFTQAVGAVTAMAEQQECVQENIQSPTELPLLEIDAAQEDQSKNGAKGDDLNASTSRQTLESKYSESESNDSQKTTPSSASIGSSKSISASSTPRSAQCSFFSPSYSTAKKLLIIFIGVNKQTENGDESPCRRPTSRSESAGLPS